MYHGLVCILCHTVSYCLVSILPFLLFLWTLWVCGKLPLVYVVYPARSSNCDRKSTITPLTQIFNLIFGPYNRGEYYLGRDQFQNNCIKRAKIMSSPKMSSCIFLFDDFMFILGTRNILGALDSQCGLCRATPNTKRCGRTLDWVPGTLSVVLTGIC